jgi:selenocysteine lyase/cysteine desulfurase
MSLSSDWLKECMVDRTIEFLNAGTLAPTLRCAFDAVYAAHLQWMTHGPGGSLEQRDARTYLNMMEEQDKCRRVVASWLGVAPSTIALLGNVTDGINASLSSIPWQPGDRILTSDEEHEALRYPLAQLKLRYGVEIDVVQFPRRNEDVSQFPSQFSDKLSPHTKMVAISEVSHRSGVRVDVNGIISALREFPNVWLLVDGAHAAGTSTSLIQDGIDFYVFPGHKWLFGPVETGVLRVSQRVLKETTPLLSGSPMMSVEGVRYEDAAGAWRYEYGTRDWSKMVGLTTAIQFRQHWMEQDLVLHYTSLGVAFAQGFETKNGRPLTGNSPVISFETQAANRIANTLWEEQKVIVKPQDGNIRISLPPWLEVDRSRELGDLIGQVVDRTPS